MDIKGYYKKKREILEKLPDSDVVIISEATPDGGRAGLRSEVRRDRAAQMIAEGRARQATVAEAQEFRRQKNGGRVQLEPPQRSSKR